MAEPLGSYFLSYSRADQDFALRFAGDLKRAGVEVWVDQLNIRPSEHWDRAIERAVQACSGLIVVLSPRSVQSENVADEISFALNSGKKVLPVLIEPCAVPLRVTRMHMVDATAGYDQALKQCVCELTSNPASIPRIPQAARAGDGAERRVTADMPSEEIRRTSEALLAYLGPIAPMLVRREAAQSASTTELHHRLAALIPVERERQLFLSALGKSA